MLLFLCNISLFVNYASKKKLRVPLLSKIFASRKDAKHAKLRNQISLGVGVAFACLAYLAR